MLLLSPVWTSVELWLTPLRFHVILERHLTDSVTNLDKKASLNVKKSTGDKAQWVMPHRLHHVAHRKVQRLRPRFLAAQLFNEKYQNIVRFEKDLGTL